MSWKQPTRPARTPNSRAELQEGRATGRPRSEHQKPRGSDRAAFARPTTHGDRLGPQPWDRRASREIDALSPSLGGGVRCLHLCSNHSYWIGRPLDTAICSAINLAREICGLDQHHVFKGFGLLRCGVRVSLSRKVSPKCRREGARTRPRPARRRRPGRVWSSRCCRSQLAPTDGDRQTSCLRWALPKEMPRAVWLRGVVAGLGGGQGRGRTADLPLFRRTLVPTELPAQDAWWCVWRS